MSEFQSDPNRDNQMLPFLEAKDPDINAERKADFQAASGAWDNEINRFSTTEEMVKIASIKKDAHAPLGVNSSDEALQFFEIVKH